MPLFKRRNRAGTSQGSVVETNPHVKPSSWDFEGQANAIHAARPTGMDTVRRQNDETAAARRAEQVRKSHGSDARW
jgi:hypothetical protein